MSTPISEKAQLPPIADDILEAMAGLPSDFSDFPRIFQDDIRPALMANEAARVLAADRARKANWIGGAVGVIGVLLSLFAIKVPQLAIVAGIAGMGIAGMGRSRFRVLASKPNL